MTIFRCDNKECELHPCYLRCEKGTSENEYGDGYIEKPTECPYLIDFIKPKWKLLPQTPMLASIIDSLEEWYQGDGWEKIPDQTKELIDGLLPFDNDYAWACKKIPQIFGWLHDIENPEYKSEAIDNFRKVKGIQVLRELLLPVFRAGFIYAEKIRAEKEYDFTRFDEESMT